MCRDSGIHEGSREVAFEGRGWEVDKGAALGGAEPFFQMEIVPTEGTRYPELLDDRFFAGCPGDIAFDP